MGRKFGVSFSWRRAVGLSGAKYRVSRLIGIPLTRSGLERKVGRAVLRPIGCLMVLLLLVAAVAAVAAYLHHP